MNKVKFKKNCYNCEHFGSDAEGDYGEWAFNYCDKRPGDEQCQDNMQKESYLSKSKVCCEFEIAACKKCGKEDLKHQMPGEGNNWYSCYMCYDF